MKQTRLNKEEQEAINSALNRAVCKEHQEKKDGDYTNIEELYWERVNIIRSAQKKLNEMGYSP